MRLLGFVICILVLSALTLGAVPASAWFPIYQTGFEAPTFDLGNLRGQDGWATWSPPELVTVQSTIVKDGAQAVSVDRRNGGPGLLGGGRFPALNGFDNVISLSIDAYFTEVISPPPPDPPAYPSYWTVLGTYLEDDFIHVNVDDLGEIHLVNQGPIDHATGTYVTRGQWNNFEQILDFRTRTATLLYNGDELYTGAFGGESTIIDFFGFYGQFEGTDDIGYFDNFSMMAEVPEPSTLGLMGVGLGVLALGWRRRRR